VLSGLCTHRLLPFCRPQTGQCVLSVQQKACCLPGYAKSLAAAMRARSDQPQSKAVTSKDGGKASAQQYDDDGYDSGDSYDDYDSYGSRRKHGSYDSDYGSDYLCWG
jgi:hypothetical protein